ncbi:MAG: uroporphyrinogen-III synthase [Planctomycetaceae bacterium]
MPTIEILPPGANDEVDAVLDRLETYHWIVFTSVNGVAGLLGRLWDRGGDLRCLGGIRLAAIGPATAEALIDYRLRADLVPETYRAESLGAALAGHVAGQRVLWARANRGRDVLPTLLSEGGAEVEELVVYRNLDVEAWPPGVVERLQAGTIDWVGLSSPSIARNVARLAACSGIELGTLRPASISPVTTAAAREAGLEVAVEAVEFTWDGILEAIIAADR